MTWRVAPPDPNPAFVRYDVVATGRSGACQVSGETAKLSKSAMPLAYANLRKAISGLYGEAATYIGTSSSLYEFGPDSSWTGNRLPKGVGSILLLRDDIDQDQMLTVTLVYTFTNVSSCANYVPGLDRNGL